MMEQQRKKIGRLPMFVGGVLAGMLLAAFIGWLAMPSLMLQERISPLGLDETVARIEAKAKQDGWVVSGVRKLDESVRKHGGGEVIPVRLVEMCQATHAARIINDESARKVSVLMPCSVAVYEDEDGVVHVVSMNSALMGRMFGGVVSDVMAGHVAPEQSRILSSIDD
jgi:uncharacterized protein (DUF302 family)